jgi:hypothetical protein
MQLSFDVLILSAWRIDGATATHHLKESFFPREFRLQALHLSRASSQINFNMLRLLSLAGLLIAAVNRVATPSPFSIGTISLETIDRSLVDPYASPPVHEH